MKKAILITVIFLVSVSSYGQTIDFGNMSNTWQLMDSTTGCCIPYPLAYTQAHYDSATLTYNGHVYQNLMTSILQFWIREEDHKVYAIDPQDSVERVLYDFTLHQGDTTRATYTDDVYTAWVTLLDSTQIAGTWYKVWHFTGKDSSLYYTDSIRHYTFNVVEGIGCTNGLYYPLTPYSLAAFSQQLLCFNNDSSTITQLSNPVLAYGPDYTVNYDNYATCRLFHENERHFPTADTVAQEAVRQLAKTGNFVSVVPNPVNETSRIVFANTVTSGSVVITDDIGRVVVLIAITNGKEAPLNNIIKVPGVYSYRFTDNTSGQVITGKFVY